MKKLFGIIFIVAFIIFAIVDTIHSLVANDAFHYFSEQPSRLLLVAAIGIAGGLVALCFFLLSPRSQRKAKLVALGSAASFVMLGGGYFTFQFASLPPATPHHMAIYILLCTVAIAAVIWFEFYQVFRKRGDDHLA